PGLRTAVDRPGRGRHVAPDPWHRGRRRHAGRDRLRRVPHPGAVRGGRAHRRRGAEARGGRRRGRPPAGSRGGPLMNRSLLSVPAVLVVLAVLSACVTGPKYQRPTLTL